MSLAGLCDAEGGLLWAESPYPAAPSEKTAGIGILWEEVRSQAGLCDAEWDCCGLKADIPPPMTEKPLPELVSCGRKSGAR
jgi:hypothetical protein